MITPIPRDVGTSGRGALLGAAWVGVLLAGYLPVILWREVFNGSIAETLPFRLGVLLVLLALGFTWKPIAPLRAFFLVLLAITAADEFLRPLLAASAAWQGLFVAQGNDSFLYILGGALLRLFMVAAPWLVLLLFGYRRQDYFLARGQLDAPAEPVRWLDIRAGQRWTTVGGQFILVLGLIVLIAFYLTVRPGSDDVARITALLPLVLLLAGLNAFTENFAFRAALLPTLLPHLGKGQSLLLAALFFGIPHYFSFPPGIFGAILATFLGWLLGKCMLETRGFLLPWLIQLPLDIVTLMSVLM